MASSSAYIIQLTTAAAATCELCAESAAELGRHCVIEDRIDGAVGIDGQPTEQ